MTKYIHPEETVNIYYRISDDTKDIEYISVSGEEDDISKLDNLQNVKKIQWSPDSEHENEIFEFDIGGFGIQKIRVIDSPRNILHNWILHDDENESVATDSKNNLDGNINGANYTSDSERGVVLEYTNENNEVITGSINPSNVTVAGWIKWNGANSDYNHIIFNEENQYEIAIDENDKLLYAFKEDGDTSWSWIEAGYTVPKDIWNHIILSVGNDELNIYVDATLVTEHSGPSILKTTYDPFIIGNRANNHSRGFSGKISDVYMYDRIFSQSDAEKLYKATNN